MTNRSSRPQHTWAHKRNRQLTERRTNTSVDIDPPGESPAERHLFAEEILTEFTSIADEHIDPITSDRAAALLLGQLHDDSFETTETRVRHSHRLKDTLGYDDSSDVPDETSILAVVRRGSFDRAGRLSQAMTTELVEEGDQAGRYAVVDATHIHARANTRQEIENGDVEGASWGVHEGQFYGYKAYLVIDAAIEPPVAALLTTGKRNDQRNAHARKEKNVLLSVISLVVVALTAKRCGKPSLMLSPSRII